MKKEKKLNLVCKYCEHECHCLDGGSCKDKECKCEQCQHNPLDEFHRTLGKGFNETAT